MTVGQDGRCSGTWVSIEICHLAPFISLPPMVQIISVTAFVVTSALLEMQKLCKKTKPSALKDTHGTLPCFVS